MSQTERSPQPLASPASALFLVPSASSTHAPVVSTGAFESLLGVNEAASLLQVHPKTLQAMARDGEVPCVRMGKYWRFRASDLDAWFKSRLTYEHQSRRVS